MKRRLEKLLKNLRVMNISKLNRVFLVFIVIVANSACNMTSKETISKKDQIDKESSKQTISYYLDSANWSVILKSIEGDLIFYSMEKEEEDTLKFLTLYTSKNDAVVRLGAYTKIFEKNGLEYTLEMKEDTFYYYSETKEGLQNFYLGEYNYRFSNLLFEKDEIDYYMLYSDSLSKVRGNDLPKLPPLTEAEKRILEERSNN